MTVGQMFVMLILCSAHDVFAIHAENDELANGNLDAAAVEQPLYGTSDACTKLNAAHQAVARMQNGDIKALRSQIDKRGGEAKSESDLRKTQIYHMKQEVQGFPTKIEDAEKAIENAEKKVDELEEALAAAKAKLAAKQADLERFKKEQDEATASLATKEASHDEKSAHDESQLKEQKARLSQMRETLCAKWQEAGEARTALFSFLPPATIAEGMDNCVFDGLDGEDWLVKGKLSCQLLAEKVCEDGAIRNSGACKKVSHKSSLPGLAGKRAAAIEILIDGKPSQALIKSQCHADALPADLSKPSFC